MYDVAFEVCASWPALPHQRWHWRRRASDVARLRLAVRCAWRAGPQRHFQPSASYVVTLTRFGRLALDAANLQGALTPAREEVAALLCRGGGDPRIVWVYAQATAREVASVVIEIVGEGGCCGE